MGRMQEIAVAIKFYRADHHEYNPWPIRRLAPDYLPANRLICPYVIRMDPETAASLLRNPVGSTFFMYSQKGLDKLKEDGKIAYGYSEVLKRRGNDTPLVICRNHREPYPLRYKHHWIRPTAPVLVLRWGLTVNKTQEGGTGGNRSFKGAEQDLNEL